MKRLLLALMGVFLMSANAMALDPENTLHLQLKDGLVVIELRPVPCSNQHLTSWH